MGVSFVQDARAIDADLVIYHEILSGSSCCSDHQSYVGNGYPSTGLIEPRGYTGDPFYHRSGDVVERDDYDVAQIAGLGMQNAK
jgi:hypothetical protein